MLWIGVSRGKSACKVRFSRVSSPWQGLSLAMVKQQRVYYSLREGPRSVGFSQLPPQSLGHLEEPQRFQNQSQIEKKEQYKKFVLEALNHRFQLHKAGQLEVNQFSAFRAFNQLDDGIPGLVIDVYGQYALIHNYSIELEIYIKSIANLLLRNPDHPLTGVYLANHYALEEPNPEFGLKVKSQTEESKVEEKVGLDCVPRLSRESACISGKAAPDHVTTINENGFVYSVALSKGIATGFEGEMRDVRRSFVSMAGIAPKYLNYKHLKNVVRSETALCAFSSTCSLGVPLAYYGVLTTNLDSSGPKLETGKKNFKLNGLPITIYSKDKVHHHVFWHKDVFRGLSSLGFEKKLFNFVFVSPPRKSWVPLDGTRGPSLHILAHHPKYQHLLKENKVGEAKNNTPKNNNPQKDTPNTIVTKRKKQEQQQNKPKFTIYNFELIDSFSDLIVMSAPLVVHGGYLVFIVNITTEEKERILKEATVGFERLLLLKQKEIEEARYVKTRKNLRLRNIKKKERLSILKASSLKPPLEEIRDQFTYTLVDVLAPPPDYARHATITSNDTTGPTAQQEAHCYTFIWKRDEFTPKVKQMSSSTQPKLTKLLTEALAKPNDNKTNKTHKLNKPSKPTKTNKPNTKTTTDNPKI